MPNASKIIINGVTKIDLTADTTGADYTLSGYTGHDAAGNSFTGNVDIVTYYSGSSDPSASLGNNGDIYLKTVS